MGWVRWVFQIELTYGIVSFTPPGFSFPPWSTVGFCLPGFLRFQCGAFHWPLSWYIPLYIDGRIEFDLMISDWFIMYDGPPIVCVSMSLELPICLWDTGRFFYEPIKDP